MAEKTDPVANAPVMTYKSADHTERYSNNMAVECRLVDFRLRFGRSVHAEPCEDQPLMVEYFSDILISPQEAKYLALWLNQEVRRYEESFGAIPAVRAAAPVPKTEDSRTAEPPAEVVN
jgi:hypothetical protein